MDADPASLEQTVADFGKAASEGHDPMFRRVAETMRAFGDGPFYAIEVMPDILNTQGGPRRNGQAEVLDRDGRPIPHLYAAGEFGGIASNMYQGGGNMAECMIFGKVAGANAAAKKDACCRRTPSLRWTPSPTYLSGKETDMAEEKSYDTSENEYVGKGQGIGGDVVVKVTMDGDKMSAIEVLEQQRNARHRRQGTRDPAFHRNRSPVC